MKPTIGIVSYLLSDDYEIEATGIPEDEDVEFDACLIYDGGKPRRKTLYICNGLDKRIEDWRGAFALGFESAPSDLPQGSCYLHVREKNARKRRRPDELRLIDLANAVHSALHRLERWTIATERACNESPDFFTLLRLCEHELGFVSVLVNKNLRYLAVSDGFEGQNPWFDRSETSMDTGLINQLTADEEFLNAINQREPFYYYYAEGDGSDSACFNIVVNGSYEARLLMQSPAGGKAPGMLAVARYLGERITGLFARYISAAERESESPLFQETLRALMDGSAISPEELREHLAIHGWSPSHTYQVTAFIFMEPESASVTQRYYEDRIAHLFDGCAELAADGLIYCIRNLSLEHSGHAAAQQELVLFLRENLCYAGASRAFSDIRELRTRAKEALAALRLGMAGDSMQWHFDFGDYMLEYICAQATRDLGGETLTHPAFTALSAYDERHGTELLETARCFMECRYNVTHAAARLHIHRTSMLARLERIDQVAGIDWDNWNNRVHLALSFLLANPK